MSVALGAQAVFSSVPSLAVPFFPHHLTNGTVFGTKFHKMGAPISVQYLSETFLILRMQRGTIINLSRFSCKALFILVIY